MNSITVLWEKTLLKLRRYYESVNGIVGFETYVATLRPEFEADGVCYFKTIDELCLEQLRFRYLSRITELLNETEVELNGRDRQLEIQILTPQDFDAMLLQRRAQQNCGGKAYLIANFTFDTFVVGKSNQFAYAASRAVADSPGETYNPLFLYGGVGLGKTHLMHAIGNEIQKNNPSSTIIYVTTETFTNEVIEAIRRDTTSQLRRKYRNADVLLIDDVQFIQRSGSTQEELFNTFNTLHDAHKQIILSSDRPPAEIPKLEDRMLSRFKSGMLADIGKPDYETRVAILKNKAPSLLTVAGCHFNLSDEVLHLIASKEDTNIRELEGALRRVILYADLQCRENHFDTVLPDLAKEALRDFFTDPVVRTITPKLVIRTVCDYYELSEEEILGPKKNREVAFPRQIAMYLLRRLTDLTYPKIGEMIGNRDHTTALYADDKISKMISVNQETERTVNDVIARIKEN